MKARGVATGATRTQTTMDIEEHLTINADLLFCKSLGNGGSTAVFSAAVARAWWTAAC